MKKSFQNLLVPIFFSCFCLFILSGCSKGLSGNSSSYSGQNYYDQYLDRPGFYDFAKPVIFLPDVGATTQ